jgi:hypothetical protein
MSATTALALPTERAPSLRARASREGRLDRGPAQPCRSRRFKDHKQDAGPGMKVVRAGGASCNGNDAAAPACLGSLQGLRDALIDALACRLPPPPAPRVLTLCSPGRDVSAVAAAPGHTSVHDVVVVLMTSSLEAGHAHLNTCVSGRTATSRL